MPIALCPELVALVACPADSPPNRARSAGSPRRGAIGVLAVLGLRARPGEVRVVNSYVLLEVLKGVVRSLGQAVEAAVKVARRDMAVGEQRGGGDGVVRREPVKRVGQHLAQRLSEFRISKEEEGVLASIIDEKGYVLVDDGNSGRQDHIL